MYKIFGFRRDEALGRVALVEFSTPAERGETYVYLLGSFNAFNEGSFRMSKAGSRWRIKTELPEGIWYYGFSVDGSYTTDPENPEKTTYKRRSYKFKRTTSVARIVGEEEAFHIPSLLYLYTFSTRTHVLLRTKRGRVKGAALIANEKVPMQRKGSDDLFDYFEVVVPAEKKMKYSFEAQMEDGRIGYLGPFEATPSEIDAPSWVLESVFYQIMPDRFAKGLKRKGPFTRDENSHGGDLRGIRDHLNHLLELGVNGLYLTPLFESKTYHGYDVEDYFHVAQRLGGDGEFDALVRELKGMGIRLILDGVFH
ncbi:alpha amylase N-terminal ig-like domain-containing protein, partial [Thermococcus sp.]|uniref:alpha amylase N-terminal ig-like domain-containing protein n=1 Tax=Thermococcus sp. TaxID=35749 RepID=UPI0025E0E853